MKVILSTENSVAAMRLREQIVKSIKHEINGVDIATWSYSKSKEGYEVVFNNSPQYIGNPETNVVFRLEIDGDNVTFSTGWWLKNPIPSDDIFCEHMGGLTEMLLKYFRKSFIKFSIVD